MTKYHIISLGCSKNQTDSERLNSDLTASGFMKSEDSEDADLIIINTCGFIRSAKEESISVIFDSIGDEPPLKKIVVIGCLSERYAQDIIKDIPEIDLVCGLYDESTINSICGLFGVKPCHGNGRIPLEISSPYEYIKISEGCSNRCSYCAIPLIRGDHKPFAPSEIIKDAKEAVKRGVRELILVAQDTASYLSGGTDLTGLIRDISSIGGFEWLRVMYLHPDHLSESLIDEMAENSRVVKYADIPFQHVSERILRLMNRQGSYEKYIFLVKKLREKIPAIRLRSTFMTGFPGETEEDFEEMISFIREAEIDRVGAFIYSPEEGTPACSMKGNVSEKIKQSRYNRLMKIQQKISVKSLMKIHGSRVRVIVEEKIDDYQYSGRSEYDAPDVDGVFYLTSHERNLKLNEIYDALVTDSTEYDLIGEII